MTFEEQNPALAVAREETGSDLQCLAACSSTNSQSQHLYQASSPARSGLSHLSISEGCKQFDEEGVVPSGLFEFPLHGAF
jgi:hypothetical protein